MTNAISKAEQNALNVSYEVLGTKVVLDLDFVKKYLVRGRSELVTDQEIVMFMNTCKMQNLNPLVNGEVYLIKYSKDEPAQMVVGKSAYVRRAYEHPDYICKEDGIVVQRGDDIVQKEGCCLYPGEVLIGGWCRVHFMRNGSERDVFKEVSFTEYNKGQANWKSKPASMINKVAISQCVREAFPKDYEGLYSEEEMIASGAIPATYTEIEEPGTPESEENQVITQDQRQALFRTAKAHFGENANDIVKHLIGKYGYESTSEMTISDFGKVLSDIQQMVDDQKEAMASETSSGESPAEE